MGDDIPGSNENDGQKSKPDLNWKDNVPVERLCIQRNCRDWYTWVLNLAIGISIIVQQCSQNATKV
ncbi:MAG: hypothetical protein AYK18_15300 [Theionarchaea archaeon DG-70]|nr:MAG: hypothetical protein AYK18_15300 [Theionarchaea archaeon DG-70]